MSANVHGTPRSSTILWATLLLATLLTWSMGALGETGRWGVAALAVISFWKGAVIILDFMALRHAPLLWRAITRYCVAHPEYRLLYGPVSINPEYTKASRDLILAYLKSNRIATDLSGLVRAKNPPRRISLKAAEMESLLRSVADIEQVSALVSELEHDKKPVPVLLKHYLKLNGRMISFNIDPDFGDCLDGLVLVDLTEVDPKFLRNLMGDDGFRSFYEYHKLPLPADMGAASSAE